MPKLTPKKPSKGKVVKRNICLEVCKQPSKNGHVSISETKAKHPVTLEMERWDRMWKDRAPRVKWNVYVVKGDVWKYRSTFEKIGFTWNGESWVKAFRAKEDPPSRKRLDKLLQLCFDVPMKDRTYAYVGFGCNPSLLRLTEGEKDAVMEGAPLRWGL